MHKVHITNNSLVTLSSVDVISPWGILTVSGENIIYLIRELQNFIVETKNKENSKDQRKKIISWSP